MMFIRSFFVFFVLSANLFAGSLRLYNDSPFKLRAVIRGADGSYLGEMVILPERYTTWSSDYPSFGSGSSAQTNPTWSQTPYTVLWYCLDGGEYGISTNLGPGSSVSAESSDGPRICKPPKKKQNQSPYGPGSGEEQLYDSQEYQEPGAPGNLDEQTGSAPATPNSS